MKKIASKNLRFEIAKIIAQRIASGIYEEDGFIPHSINLTKEFNASRTSVREALSFLASKGFIKSIPGTGTKVLPSQQWNLFDSDVLDWLSHSTKWHNQISKYIIELRFMLEPEFIKLAVQNAVAIDLMRMETALKEMKESIDDNTIYTKKDAEFHTSIILATGNPLLINMAKIFSHPLFNLIYTSNKNISKAKLTASLKMHTDLYQAILTRQTEKALEIERLLLQDVKRLTVDLQI